MALTETSGAADARECHLYPLRAYIAANSALWSLKKTTGKECLIRAGVFIIKLMLFEWEDANFQFTGKQ